MSLNPFLLKKQLTENANDLNEFAKDLKKWGEEMKRKEESSLKGTSEPPSKIKVRKSPSSKNKVQSKKLPPKIGSTDYAAWDKFDVEAELEKLEDDANEDSELTDECNDNMYDEAILEKEKGNKFVKQQNWEEAIKSYSKAIDCYSYDPIFYANRALCYIKKNMFAEAEKDCNLSLKLDQTYVKAYQRRAAARIGLNKLEYAEQDYLKVLELEPKNQETKKELEILRKKIGKTRATEIEQIEQRPISKFTASRHKFSDNAFESNRNQNPSNGLNKVCIDDSKPSPSHLSDDIIIVKSINKKPHLRSQKPLRRIEIVEINENEPISTVQSNEAVKTHVVEKKPISTHQSNEAVKTHVVEKKQVEIVKGIDKSKSCEIPDKNRSDEVGKAQVVEKKLEIVTDSNKKVSFVEDINKSKENELIEKSEIIENNEESTEVISEFKKKQKMRNLKNSQNLTAWPKPNQSSTCIKSDDFKIIENKNPKEEKNLINSDKKYENDDFDKTYVAPKNSVQFYSAWKNLKSTEEKYRYLRKLDPSDIPNIFRSSLESNVFSNILEVLVKHSIEGRTPVSKILNSLSQVQRFSTITMFMTESDKNYLWKLIDYIKETNEISQEEVDSLIKKYEL